MDSASQVGSAISAETARRRFGASGILLIVACAIGVPTFVVWAAPLLVPEAAFLWPLYPLVLAVNAVVSLLAFIGLVVGVAETVSQRIRRASSFIIIIGAALTLAFVPLSLFVFAIAQTFTGGPS